jgi:hypothetical protein
LQIQYNNTTISETVIGTAGAILSNLSFFLLNECNDALDLSTYKFDKNCWVDCSWVSNSKKKKRMPVPMDGNLPDLQVRIVVVSRI